MSANNVIWVMHYEGKYHVWYSGCYDNNPKEPDRNGLHYISFKKRADALVYGHDLVKQLESSEDPSGMQFYVEYGVVELISDIEL